MPHTINDLLIKPTYDVSFYGDDVVIPIGTDTIALQSMTWSALDELLQVSPTNADAHIESYSRLISDIDTLGIAHEGDGIRFNRTYEYLSDQSAWVYKLAINVCAALDVTAFTSGAHSVDSVRFIVTERRIDGTLVKDIEDQTIDTGMTDTAAVETKAAIVLFETNKPFKIEQGNILRLQIIFNSTDTLIATSFEGIMPQYYFQEGALAKTMVESAMILHLHSALDHAFIVLRDSSLQDQLDFSGVPRIGVSRGGPPI